MGRHRSSQAKVPNNRKYSLEGPIDLFDSLKRATANYLVSPSDVNVYSARASRVDAAWQSVLSQKNDQCSPNICRCPSFKRLHRGRNVKAVGVPRIASLTENTKPLAIRHLAHMHLCLPRS